MKKVCMMTLFLGILSSGFARNSYTLSYDLSRFEFSEKHDRITGKGMSANADTGAPDLPVEYLHFIIPADREVKGIEILNKSLIQIPGKYNIHPVQLPVPLLAPFLGFPPLIKPDANIYSKDTLYPGKTIELTHQGIFDGARIVEIAVYPIQYNPTTQSLYIFSEIQFTFMLKQSTIPLRPQIRKLKTQKTYSRFLETLVENKNEISVYYSKPHLLQGGYFSPDYYELTIVSTPKMAPAFKPLAQWLIEKGIPTVIRTTDWIYANYDGIWDLRDKGFSFEFIGDRASAIKEYLIDAYLNNGLAFAILAGDDETGFPFRYAWSIANYDNSNFVIPSDLYFQDFTGNWEIDEDGRYGEPGDDQPDFYPEIFVGRILSDNYDEAVNWVKKRLTYELNPENRDLMLDVVWNYENGPQWGYFKPYVDSAMSLMNSFASQFRHHPVENHPATPDNLGLVDTLSTGYGLLFIDAHGNWSRWVTADPSFGFHRFKSYPDPFPSLDDLNNPGRYGVVYSISCDHAAFDWDPSPSMPTIAEGFVNDYRDSTSDGNPVGAVAFLGNTRYGWMGPSQRLRDLFIMYLFGHPNFPSNSPALGVVESYSRTAYSGGLRWYIRYTHNFFGSPEMELYRNIPENLTAFHPETIKYGSSVIFVVTVQELKSQALVEGARVTLYKPGNSGTEVYQSKLTNARGKAIFTELNPNSPGIMKVTVTHPKYLPYQGEVKFIGPEIQQETQRLISEKSIVPDLKFEIKGKPGIVSNIAFLEWTIPEKQRINLSVYDITGRKIITLRTGRVNRGIHKVQWYVRQKSGVYFVVLKGEKEVKSRKIIVQR